MTRSGAAAPRVVLAVVAALCVARDVPATTDAERAAARMAVVRGDQALEAGDIETARTRFEEAVRLDPESASALDRLGVTLARLGLGDEAVEVLERAVAVDPGDPKPHLDLGVLYLARGDLFWAADELAVADALAPDDPGVAFHRGIVLFRLEEYDAAADALARVVSDPGYGARALFHLAMARAAAGEAEASREAFERLAEQAPGTAHGDSAAVAATILLEREWEVPPLLAGFVSVAGQYDSNAAAEPDDSAVPLGSDAGGLALRGALTVSPLATPAHVVSATVAASRTFHFADPASQFSLTTAAGAAGWRWRFRALDTTHALQLGYRYDIGMLDGGDLTDDPEFYAYREAHAASARYTLDEGDQWYTFLEATYRHAVFADMRRDGDAGSLRVGQNLAFFAQRLKLLLSVGARWEDARGDGYDLWAVEAAAGISALGPWSLEMIGLLRYGHEDHYDSAFYSSWGPGRVDDVIGVTLSVGRRIWEFLGVEASWLHTEHFSTTPAFDYARDVASLALKAVFR